MKNSMEIAVAAGTALSLLLSFPAQAVRKTYDFQLINLTGELQGENLGGWFSFDDEYMKGEGFEYTSWTCLDECSDSSYEFDGELLFYFNFLGNIFTEQDERRDKPIVYFDDGDPTRIYFKDAGYSFQFSANGATDANGDPLGLQTFVYYLEWPVWGRGTGSLVFIDENGKRYYSPDVHVPEPSTLLGLGLLGLFGFGCKVKDSRRR